MEDARRALSEVRRRRQRANGQAGGEAWRAAGGPRVFFTTSSRTPPLPLPLSPSLARVDAQIEVALDQATAHVATLEMSARAEDAAGSGDPLARAERHFGIAYALSSLAHLFLRVHCVDTAAHPVRQELERVKQYKAKIDATKAKLAGARSTRDATVAKRLVLGALSTSTPVVRPDEPAASRKRSRSDAGTATPSRASHEGEATRGSAGVRADKDEEEDEEETSSEEGEADDEDEAAAAPASKAARKPHSGGRDRGGSNERGHSGERGRGRGRGEGSRGREGGPRKDRAGPAPILGAASGAGKLSAPERGARVLGGLSTPQPAYSHLAWKAKLSKG